MPPQWVPISEIRKSIEETLRPWALPRKIDVLWDIMLDPETKVYADLGLVRRLVVNLATNAIRVTPEKGVVLVQLQCPRGSSVVRWAIIDRGGGIKRNVLKQMSGNCDFPDGNDAAAVSTIGGEGLGLLISGQLAALHFSHLQICSRFGQGTEVSFKTVFGGPRGVADAWANWRMENRTALKKPRHRDGRLQRVDRGNHLDDKKIPDARMTWSDPQIIPICDRVTHSRLSDLLVRSTLAASSGTNISDQDEVRLGTLPIGESHVAAGRLDDEMRRLTKRFRSESRALTKQVKKLSEGV